MINNILAIVQDVDNTASELNIQIIVAVIVVILLLAGTLVSKKK